MPGHLKPIARPWTSRRPPPTTAVNVTRHSTLGSDGVFGPNHHSEMDVNEQPDEREEDMVLHFQFHERDRDALKAAYANRHNIVMDSTVPHFAPHIVVTPPEQNIQDYYTPWLNATGPQWTSHLMVTMPLRKRIFLCTYCESCFLPVKIQDLYCISDARTCGHEQHCKRVAKTMSQGCHQAIAASETARKFLAFDQYVCPSEKPFHWTDPAEPFLQRRNQFRGTIIIESPSPFSIPHIIINEPPPQDPWIVWHNATTSPQDHGFGQYLTVPHRLVWYTNMFDGADDYWSSPFHSQLLQAEQLDLEDADISGSSSSESEPETPDPDSSMDDFLLDENGRDFLDSEIQDGDVNFFDSCDDSPWSGIINRYSRKATAPAPDDPPIADSEVKSDEEDDLPPFDNWYQSVASRSMMTTAV